MTPGLREAREILTRLELAGVALVATPAGKLRCAPANKVDEELRQELLHHKPALLHLLSYIKESYIPSPPSPPSPPGGNADNNRESSGNGSGDGCGTATPRPSPPGEKPAFLRQAEELAGELGLVARWSEEFGYISLHDPTTGEWYDVRTAEAPDWARAEAFKRRELRRAGDRMAHRRTAREMEELWQEEHQAEELEYRPGEEHPMEER